MATQKNGLFGGWKGKLGNAVGYVDKNGTQIIRSRSKRNNENPTDKEKENWLRTEIINVFLSILSHFVKLSFNLEGKLNKDNWYNMAARENRKAIVGDYPNLYIDFNLVLLSKGDMPVVNNPKVTITETSLTFTWDTAITQEGMASTDQVMLIACMPQKKKAFYIRSGAKRSKGTETLEVLKSSEKQLVEVYISFISEDHSSISNSTYLGQLEVGGKYPEPIL